VGFTDPWGLFKINLLPPESGAWRQGEAAKDNPSKAIVIAHGDYKGGIWGPDGKLISLDDLAEEIREHQDWREGMDIELRICAAADGKDSLIDKIKRLFPNSNVSGPRGDVSPNGWTYWPSIPKYGVFPSSSPDHWETK
jgi:hypothetical protein